jgi:hypothetical protein
MTNIKDITKNNTNLTPTERASLRKKKIKKVSFVTEPENNIGTIPLEDIEQMVKEQYRINVIRIKDENLEQPLKIALIDAEEIWSNVQILMMSDRYKRMDDDEKIDLIRNDFANFYKNFPIVSRYMICIGKYKQSAFTKMLVKYSTMKRPINAPKDYNEKIWIEQQADYIRYLWEDDNNGVVFSQQDSDRIWQEAYNNLSSEFNQFRDLYEETETKIKQDKIRYKKEILYELSARIISGVQRIKDQDMLMLIEDLDKKRWKQRFKTVLNSIDGLKQLEPIIEGVGDNYEAYENYEYEMQQNMYKKNSKKFDIRQFI